MKNLNKYVFIDHSKKRISVDGLGGFYSDDHDVGEVVAAVAQDPTNIDEFNEAYIGIRTREPFNQLSEYRSFHILDNRPKIPESDTKEQFYEACGGSVPEELTIRFIRMMDGPYRFDSHDSYIELGPDEEHEQLDLEFETSSKLIEEFDSGRVVPLSYYRSADDFRRDLRSGMQVDLRSKKLAYVSGAIVIPRLGRVIVKPFAFPHRTFKQEEVPVQPEHDHETGSEYSFSEEWMIEGV